MNLAIMNELLHSLWSVGLVLISLAIGLIGLAMDIHIACSRNFQVMLTALEKSSAAVRWIQIWGTRNLISRTMVATAMAGAIARPRYFLVRGLLDAEEVAKFPEYLRRRMKISAFLTTVGFVVFMTMGLLRKITEIWMQ